MTTEPLDLAGLLAAAAETPAIAGADAHSPYALMTEANRARLRDLRGKLLQLHKVLLDDARVSYEMDRGRVASSATLLQLVIGDPWFAWLHSLSELIVRIDQTAEPDSPATDADAATLIEQVERPADRVGNGRGLSAPLLRRAPAAARRGPRARRGPARDQGHATDEHG